MVRQTSDRPGFYLLIVFKIFMFKHFIAWKKSLKGGQPIILKHIWYMKFQLYNSPTLDYKSFMQIRESWAECSRWWKRHDSYQFDILWYFMFLPSSGSPHKLYPVFICSECRLTVHCFVKGDRYRLRSQCRCPMTQKQLLWNSWTFLSVRTAVFDTLLASLSCC